MGIRLYAQFKSDADEREFERIYVGHVLGVDIGMHEIAHAEMLIEESRIPRLFGPNGEDLAYEAWKRCHEYDVAAVLDNFRVFGWGKGFELPESLQPYRGESYNTSDITERLQIMTMNEEIRALPMAAQVLIRGFYWG